MFIEKQLGSRSNGSISTRIPIAENSCLIKNTRLTKKPLSTRWIRTNAHMDYNRENGTITFIYNVLD